jgi:EAL domain-containing protein (putative c-di-GMP-specific phosphodiesterase class I)
VSQVSERAIPWEPERVSPSMPIATRDDLEAQELDRLLAGGEVYSVYQPIVELDTGATVGYEALARGPQGGALERPDLLFAAARRVGRLTGLDRACQSAAISGAEIGGLRSPWTLFVNVEPETANATFLQPVCSNPEEDPGAFSSTLDFQIIVELTERALIAEPIELLKLVARVRARGWGIALDDVGAHRDSLALLPLLQPDVIKLDLRLVQERPTAEIAQIVSAVHAEAERSDTVILAEGIETEEHLNIALAMGATLGQGWLLGRPAALPEIPAEFNGSRLRIADRGDPVSKKAPFALGAAVRPPRRSRKALLIEISKHLERQAMIAGGSTVVLATFQDASFFTQATRRRYAQLASQAALVGALGQGMPPEPLPGVRGCVLDPSDPLVGEWDIVVVGPHFTATLVARDLGDTGPDNDRRFEFVLSHNQELAIQVAFVLMSRVWPGASYT